MEPPIEILTLAGTLNELERRGFTEHFKLSGGRLRALGAGIAFGAEQLVVAEYYRFEGVSDPDDMAILYAIETGTGLRGTLTDAFGAYSDPAVGDFMDDVRIASARTPATPSGRSI
jgi:hypothetical protein